MKYVLQDLERQKLEYPVICGGAALTRKYVEDDLRREYSHAVFYADDAFAGLHVMEDLTTENGARETRLTEGRTVKEYATAAAAVDEQTGPPYFDGAQPGGRRRSEHSDTAILGRSRAQRLRPARSLSSTSTKRRCSRISLAMLAVVLAAASLASAAVYARGPLRKTNPIGLSACKFALAAVVVIPAVAYYDGVGGFQDLSRAGWLSLLGIGVMSTAIARCGYVWVISVAGSVTASLLTYIVPAAALVLGFVFLGETVNWSKGLETRSWWQRRSPACCLANSSSVPLPARGLRSPAATSWRP